MQHTSVVQDQMTEQPLDNTGAFRTAYGRLNGGEKKEVQEAFCSRYKVTASAFRMRMAGHTRVSDTELAWMKDRVATYFPAEA